MQTRDKVLNPILPPFHPYDIFHYISNVKKHNLSEKLKSQIEQAFHESELLALSRLIDAANTAKDTHEALAGLTTEQKARLHMLIENQKQFHALYDKQKANHADYKQFLAEQQELARLQQKMDWWKINAAALNKPEFWENVLNVAKMQSEKNHETEKEKRKRMHQITDVREDYQKYKTYMGLTNDDLLNLHDVYFAQIEEQIHTILSKRKTWPAMLTEYVSLLLTTLEKEQKQVMYSMLFRMQSADYYKDIQCDDLLAFSCKRIYSHANIQVNQSGIKPPRRRGLSADHLLTFARQIRYYHQSHRDEFIREKMSQIGSLHLPNDLANRLSKEDDNHPACSQPSILFLLNLFAKVQKDLHKKRKCSSNLIHHEDNTLSLLDKLKLALIQAETAFNALPVDRADNVHQLFEETLTRIRTTWASIQDEIKTNILIDTQRDIDLIIKRVLSTTPFTTYASKDILNRIASANQFTRQESQAVISPYTDLTLSLAMRLATYLTQQQALNPVETDNICHLMALLNKRDLEKNSLRLRQLLGHINDLVKPSIEYNEAAMLHLALNILELPFESETDITESLARHQHIARQFNEPWKEVAAPESHWIIHYINHVYLKIMPLSPLVNLDTFDTNEITTMLQQANITAIPASHPIRQQAEKIIFERINNVSQLCDYLMDPKSDIINQKRLFSLKERIAAYFSEDLFKQGLISSMQHAVLDLLKNHLVAVMTGETTLNSAVITSCTTILGADLLTRLRDDRTLHHLINTHVANYHGNTTHAAPVLLLLWPTQRDQNKLIMHYADKRLDYLQQSGEFTRTDYDFFRSIEKCNSRSTIKQKMTAILTNTTLAWSPASAQFVETFGNVSGIMQYRAKRIDEFLDQLSQPDYPAEIESAYQRFVEMCWHGRVANGKLVDPSITRSDKRPLSSRLVSVISQHGWSPFLDRFIQDNGGPAETRQIQTLFHQTVHQQSSKLQGADNNDQLARLILKLQDTLHQASTGPSLSPDNIMTYLAELDKTIIQAIEQMLDQQASTLSFNLVSQCSHLLLNLATAQVKQFILQAHQSELAQHPHWFHLVNHMDSHRDIIDLEASLTEQDTSPEFKQFMLFSKHYSQVKHKINRLRKQLLLNEAGITLPDQGLSSFPLLLQSNHLSDKQLISLWHACATKCHAFMQQANSQPASLLKFANYLNLTSEQLITRAPQQSNILNHITKAAKYFNQLSSTFSAYAATQPDNAELAYFCKQQSSGLFQPTRSALHRLLAMKLIVQVDHYITSRLPQAGHLATLKSLSQSDATLTPDIIKQALNLKRHDRALKLGLLMKLHTHLTRMVSGDGDPAQLISLIDSVMQEGARHAKLGSMMHFNCQLSRLKKTVHLYFNTTDSAPSPTPAPRS